MATPQDLRRFRANLKAELDGAALYSAIARAERDPTRRDLFLQLADAERQHAAWWREKLLSAGQAAPSSGPSLRTRLLGLLARWFGPRFVLPSLAAAEFADRDKYAGQADAQALSADERGHATIVRAMAAPAAAPNIGADIARAGPWHRGASGNDLRAAVLGANDGLVSNFCLIMGIAGAGAAPRTVLLSGAAGLIAGACSMALGEWLSVTNARELANSQIAREAQEIRETPQAEQHELALIYQAKGLAKSEAQRVAPDLMKSPRGALDTLTREELGIDPNELGGNAWRAAGASFGLFALGAIVPVLPHLWLQGARGILASVLASALALAAVGAATSLFNGRSAGFSALRQVVFGCGAAALTYGIGHWLGVSLS